MQIEQLDREFERVQTTLADGPIVPSVTVDEVRSYLASHYQFQNELPLDEVVQVHVAELVDLFLAMFRAEKGHLGDEDL